MAGKGDKPRPVNKKIYNSNYDDISFESNRKNTQIEIKNKNGKKTYKY
jgi:hypothetical protein